MPLLQYAGLRLNFNCCLSGFNMLVSSLIFTQAVQTLGSIAGIMKDISQNKGKNRRKKGEK